MGTLYRSRRDRWVSGLIGGLGQHFGISSTALRIVMILCMMFSGGTILFIYLIASLVISKEPYNPYDPYFNNGNNGWHNGPGGGYKGYHNGNRGYHGQSGYGYGPQPGQQPPYGGNPYGNNPNPGFGTEETSNLDSMMGDIEKKAMKKELEELRKKLANYEKGDN